MWAKGCCLRGYGYAKTKGEVAQAKIERRDAYRSQGGDSPSEVDVIFVFCRSKRESNMLA